MPLKIDAAVKYLDDNAEDGSTGLCAKYVREALAAGGLVINPHPVYAKSYGPFLTVNGFAAVVQKDYVATKGDIAVIQDYPAGVDPATKKAFSASDPAGHITMYDGTQWVSDFKQIDMWGGPGYRKHQPDYQVYRP